MKNKRFLKQEMKQKAKALNYQKKCGQEHIIIKERDVSLATNPCIAATNATVCAED